MSELYRDFIEDQFDRVVNAINNELPTPLPADIGKVVQVVSDGGTGAEYALDAVPNELPTPTTSDIDKVVKVVSDGGTGAEYALDAVPNELPTPTTSDIDKIVKVVSDGSGGAEYSLDNESQELPTPASTNLGKVATVVSDGSGGYEWGAEDIPYITIYVQGAEGSGIITKTVNTNPTGLSRSQIMQYFTNPTKLGNFVCQIEYFNAMWTKRFNGYIRPVYFDSVEQGLFFKGVLTMNTSPTTKYDVTFMLSSVDANSDTLTVTAI